MVIVREPQDAHLVSSHVQLVICRLLLRREAQFPRYRHSYKAEMSGMAFGRRLLLNYTLLAAMAKDADVASRCDLGAYT